MGLMSFLFGHRRETYEDYIKQKAEVKKIDIENYLKAQTDWWEKHTDHQTGVSPYARGVSNNPASLRQPVVIQTYTKETINERKLKDALHKKLAKELGREWP